jgi:LPS-assembly protein
VPFSKSSPAILASALALAAGTAAGQGVCLPPLAPDRQPVVNASPTLDDFLDIEAGNFSVRSDASALFSDGIRFVYRDGIVTAERALYDPTQASIDVVGRVRFENPEFSVFADDAAYDRDAGEISFAAAGFDMPQRPAHGEAEQIVVRNAQSLSLVNLSFTTCPQDDVDWELVARELEIDTEQGFGTARGVKLRFKGVPILYAPYFTFPIDNQRKSGFLTPHIAERVRTGLDIGVPYYFNLAPNYDLTLEPRYMSKRGVQVNTDFRYLMPRSEGSFNFEFLDDSETGDSRSYLDLQHESYFGRGWQLLTGIEEVSDAAYFEDLGDSLSVTSQTHLNRFLDIGYFAPHWFFQSRLQNYQTIDTTIADVDQPYERVPQLQFEGNWGERIVGFETVNELVNFDRRVGTTGWRFDSTDELSLRFARAGMYLTPAVALRHTQYWLNEPGSTGEDMLTRSVPISSVDAGLSFDRDAGRTDRWIQTLEPRLLFVHVPYEDQSALPVFDTIVPDFNLVQLFRKYEYVGPDRIADTDHVSFGLTTRLIEGASGRERVSATLGQTRYQEPKRVTLPNEQPSIASRSDYVAELAVNLSSSWNLDLGYQWNDETKTTVRAETRFEFRPGDDRLFGFGYRKREGLLEQGDLAVVWPVGESWRLIGQYSYSLLEQEPLERFFGLEYSSCCWRLRLVGRRYIIRSTGENDSTISIQLELKGLSQRATSPEELLDRGILGYRSLGGTDVP